MCGGQGGRDGGGAGVIDGIFEDVVHFHRVSGRAIDQGCRTRGGRSSQRQTCLASIQVF